MRRRDIVSGIILILSIIDFALAAPVLLQKERQADAYVIQIPKDVITVLGKRAGEGELEKLAEDYFKKTVDSSGVPASSSSTKPIPPEFSPESTNVVEHVDSGSKSEPDSLADSEYGWINFGDYRDILSPSPSSSTKSVSPGFGPGSTNVAGSPANELSSSSSTESIPESTDIMESLAKKPASSKPDPYPLLGPPQAPSKQLKQGIDDNELDKWLLNPPLLKEYGSVIGAQKRPWIAPDLDWEYWSKLVNQPSKKPVLAKESGLAPIGPIPEGQVQPGSKLALTSRPELGWISLDDFINMLNPGPVSHMVDISQPHAEFPPVERVRPAPSAGPNFDWTNAEHRPPLKPESPENPGLPRLSNTEPSNPDPSSPSLQTELENPSDQQPLSEEEQRQAALYAAKGKAKQLRRISGTTRDVGNVAQRVF